jgi:hypothetical protein
MDGLLDSIVYAENMNGTGRHGVGWYTTSHQQCIGGPQCVNRTHVVALLEESRCNGASFSSLPLLLCSPRRR